MTVEIVDRKELAEQLLEQAKEQNIELVGPGRVSGAGLPFLVCDIEIRRVFCPVSVIELVGAVGRIR